MELLSADVIYKAGVLVLSTLLISACSDASNSTSVESVGSVSDADTSTIEVELDNSTDTLANTTEEEQGDAPGIDEVVDPPTDGNESESVSTDSDVADQIVQINTRVDFEIVVPAYQSDSLQVRVGWGENEVSADWIGDEFWRVTAELLANTEHSLVVTFFDNNGETELAGFEHTYRTGNNDSESLTFTVDQFDADRFDADGDGVSNLDESIAGTDPSIDEESLLQISDSVYLSGYSRLAVSQGFESRLGSERPFTEVIEQNLIPGVTLGSSAIGGTKQILNLDIDANGNGTLAYSWYVGSASQSIEAIRTQSENAVSWEGSRRAYQSSYNRNLDFTNTVTVVDGNTREFVEEVVGSNIGTYAYRWETSSKLTGRLIAGTTLCEAVAGTVTATKSQTPAPSFGGAQLSVTTISKEIDDAYWRVVIEEDGIQKYDYFVRELRMHQVGTATHLAEDPYNAVYVGEDDDPNNAFFICDFAGI